jgi:hypothetical protein
LKRSDDSLQALGEGQMYEKKNGTSGLERRDPGIEVPVLSHCE